MSKTTDAMKMYCKKSRIVIDYTSILTCCGYYTTVAPAVRSPMQYGAAQRPSKLDHCISSVAHPACLSAVTLRLPRCASLVLDLLRLYCPRVLVWQQFLPSFPVGRESLTGYANISISDIRDGYRYSCTPHLAKLLDSHFIFFESSDQSAAATERHLLSALFHSHLKRLYTCYWT